MNVSLKNTLGLLPATILLVACQGPGPDSTGLASADKVATSKQEVIMSGKITKKEVTPVLKWQLGTVKYMDMEGGFYGIVTDDGRRLLTMGLPTEYRQHGAKVKVQGKLLKDVMTIQQWGTPFKISAIELLAPGLKHPPSSAVER